MIEPEIRDYLASIGAKGGRAGTGKSKLRGGRNYYRKISQLAAVARARKARSTKAGRTQDQKRRAH